MSKQYLTVHTVDNAHPSPIFALATTPEQVFSASGGSSIKIHSAACPADPPTEIAKAHKTGIHHLATGRGGPGKVLASVGFGDEVKIWARTPEGGWKEHSTVSPWGGGGGGAAAAAGRVWAVALTADEQFLACTSESGRVALWDLVAGKAARHYETSSASDASATGCFGMSVDVSPDGRLTASGHQGGTVYVFNNDSGRMIFALTALSKPIRAVKFSPHGTRLATAGDAGIIAIYDTLNGEHVASLSPGGAGAVSPWVTCLDWSHTGEHLLSGSFDGRVRVWSVESGACVATHSEGDRAVWAVRWLVKTNPARPGESFCAAGQAGAVTFYREATGS